MKALLARAMTTFDEEGNTLRLLGSVVRGFSRYELGENDVLNVQIGIANRGDAEMLWLSEPCTISLAQNGAVEIFSDEDEILGSYMQDGFVAIYGSVVDGKIDLTAAATGFLPKRYPFFILLSSTSPIEMDLWETTGGFDKLGTESLEGFTPGDSEFSCGDWTSTPRVISVGNYVTKPPAVFTLAMLLMRACLTHFTTSVTLQAMERRSTVWHSPLLPLQAPTSCRLSTTTPATRRLPNRCSGRDSPTAA